MHPQTRKEALRKTLDYIEALHSEFVEEIEKMTADIHIHKAMKAQFRGPAGEDIRQRLQAWRKKSHALYRRRTRLKSMKECLERQIHDLQTALNRLDTLAVNTSPLPGNLTRGQLISFNPQGGFSLGLPYDAR